ncbi:MAG: histidine phosphatase family protein [Dermatophilaceae bacterium]
MNEAFAGRTPGPVAGATPGAPARVPAGARRVILLRHGQTAHNAAGVWQGQLDTPLSEVGERQAEAVGPALAASAPSRVVTSDLARAKRTGESVGRALGVPVLPDPRFREIHAGAWQGLTTAEVAAGWPEEWAAISRGEDVRRGGDGESMSEVRARVGAGLDELVEGMDLDECVVVSTHGAAGRAAAAWLLGIEQQLAWRVLGAFDNCHWSELAQGRSGWRITSWNVGVGGLARPGLAPPSGLAGESADPILSPPGAAG